MTFLNSIILGIIEGFTEFLPISSTGHLVLSSHLLKLEQSDFLKSFEIAIQLGAILPVAVLNFTRIFISFEVVHREVDAFMRTAAIRFLLYGFIKNILLESAATVLWSLLLGGVVLIVFEFWYSKTALKINAQNSLLLSYRHCFFIGLFQALAVIPGVSRAGATILGGLWLGIPRKTIVEFSFLLALPTMAGATGLDLLKNASLFSYDQFGILAVGFFISFTTAVLAIKLLLSFIQRHTFVSFGVYRIILAVVFLLFLI